MSLVFVRRPVRPTNSVVARWHKVRVSHAVTQYTKCGLFVPGSWDRQESFPVRQATCYQCFGVGHT